MSIASLDAQQRRRHTPASPTRVAPSRLGTRSTALPAFAQLGDNDTLGRHYARAYLAYHHEDATAARPIGECA